MSGSQALFRGIVDYAGLFPPAQLPLDQAFANYLRYRSGGDAWLLGRFVCPAVRLGELSALPGDVLQGAGPAVLAVLGRGGKDAQEYFANVKLDLADIARVRAALGGRIVVDAYEVRLPASAFGPLRSHQLSSLIATTAYLVETTGPDKMAPFFESPDLERAAVLAVIQALHDDRHSNEAPRRQRCQAPGFKLRTGGLEAAVFPGCAQVALVLAACGAARVPFKATAGLHHALRHFSSEVNAAMHGFVNVFAAGCLMFAQGLDTGTLTAVLEDENPQDFDVTADGLRWRDLTVGTDALVQARQVFTSFGSCSFEQPCADLRGRHWLP